MDPPASGDPSAFGTLTGPARDKFVNEIADIGFWADYLSLTDVQISEQNGEFTGNRAYCSYFSHIECGVSLPGDILILTGTDAITTIDPEDTVMLSAEQQGIPLAHISGRTTIEGISDDYRLFGGWLEHTFFFVVHGEISGVDVSGFDYLMAGKLGNPTHRSPVSGSATWTGAMVGIDRHAPTQRLRGDADLTYDFTSESVDVALTNIQNLNGRDYADLTWSDVPVHLGHFWGGVGSNSLNGIFYGPNHEEVSGEFERNQIVGAFGARRQ